MNETVVLGTHMLSGTPISTAKGARSLQAEFKVCSQIAKCAALTDYKIVILKQPRGLYGIADRAKDRDDWERVAYELGPSLKLVYDADYVPLEPVTLAWNKLYRYAFECLHAKCFVYVDMMMPRWNSQDRKRAIANLAKLAKLAITVDYVIGDYTPAVPKDSRNPTRKQDVTLKRTIEACVKQMLADRFPTLLAGWPLFEALERPRSEFHAIGRRLYDALKGLAPVPYDYGLQMLIVARAKGFKICRQDIGPVPEFGGYSAQKMVWQLRRVDFQLAQIQE
jgi:hypothetical protein